MKTKIENTKRAPVYFPLDLLAKLQESARDNGRSFTKEVIQRLKLSYLAQEKSAHASESSTYAEVTSGDLSPVKFNVKDYRDYDTGRQ